MARKKIEEPTAALWYVSYGDLVTNMLCFFVLLFAFSTLDSPKKRQESQATEQHFFDIMTINESTGAHQWLTKGEQGIMTAPVASRNESVRLLKKIKNKLAKVAANDRIEVLKLDQMVRIQIPANVLFESGSAQMKKSAEEVLMALEPILNSIGNFIRIDGHTDNVPPKQGSLYPSNWELSTARACSVVRFFTEDMKMSPDRFAAQGFADNYPKVENISEETREINRRVDINILNKKHKNINSESW
jgi:chemotaxis protein MotB